MLLEKWAFIEAELSICTDDGVGSKPPEGLSLFMAFDALRAFNTTRPQGPGTQNDIFNVVSPEI